MNEYLVKYQHSSDPWYSFLCRACDAQNAAEQARDAYPDATILAVYRLTVEPFVETE